MRQQAKHRFSLLPQTCTQQALHVPRLPIDLLSPQTAGTLHLKTPSLRGPPREFQYWQRQVGIIQRAFPNSTLRLDWKVWTVAEVDVHRLLSCTELRRVTICSTLVPGRPDRQFWQAMAALGRQHGGRLQLVAWPGTFQMLQAEPSLAGHVSQAWGGHDFSSLVDLPSSLSSLTKLTLTHEDSVQGKAGLLEALRQLSALQSLHCWGTVMQTLLVNSVPRSWSLLKALQISLLIHALDVSLVEQQCPQLQALAMNMAIPLCLTALTSLTCQFWLPQDINQFQCSRLSHLHVERLARLGMLPSTLTSLSLGYDVAWPMYYGDPMGSQQSLVHISYSPLLKDLSHIQGLVPIMHFAVATSVTSVHLTIHPQAIIPPDMFRQHLEHFGIWFPHLQRVHIHLAGEPAEEQVLISAAWLPAHCRLFITHRLKCRVCIVECPSGRLLLPLSLRSADE